MFFKVCVSGPDAHLLSYYFGKHPDSIFERGLKYGKVHAFYGTYKDDLVEFFVLHTADTISLYSDSPEQYDIQGYINHRGFSANSIFCASLEIACSNIIQGKCKEHPDLVDRVWQIKCSVGPVAARMSKERIKQLFDAVGLECELEDCTSEPLFGIQPYSLYWLHVQGQTSITKLIRQMFVLIPVIDNYRHHWTDRTHVEKLKRLGEGWLENHPMRHVIAYRFLQHRPLAQELINEWNSELVSQPTLDADSDEEIEAEAESDEKEFRPHEIRHLEILKHIADSKVVADLGCSYGQLTLQIAALPHVEEVLAVDISSKVLEKLEVYISRKSKTATHLNKIQIMQSSLHYYDPRLTKVDCVVLCEVIEHIDPQLVSFVVNNIWGQLAPSKVIVTTPNREFNVLFTSMKTEFRHPDHRFEWTRQEFQEWCQDIATRYRYDVSIIPVGEEHPEYGPISQMAVFNKRQT